jgi:hypothetical protein
MLNLLAAARCLGSMCTKRKEQEGVEERRKKGRLHVRESVVIKEEVRYGEGREERGCHHVREQVVIVEEMLPWLAETAWRMPS